MIDALSRHPYLVVGALGVWFCIAIAGYFSYVGSTLHYVFFSLAFLALLVDGVISRFSFGYVCLAIFLWLGFWLKLELHLILNYAYLEPVGRFDGSAALWDAVMVVSSVGAVAVIVARWCFAKIIKKSALQDLCKAAITPSWYPSARIWLWGAIGAVIITLPIFNWIYGISQIGIVPSLILPWHLNAVIIWLVGFGVAAMLFTLIHWDHALKSNWMAGMVGVFAEALLSSVSSISRAMYIFKTVPYLVVLYAKRLPANRIGVRGKLWIASMWACLLAVSLTLVTVLRYAENSPITASSNKTQMTMSSNLSSVGAVAEQLARRVAHLVVDRWIGLEGVMAVASYPEKGGGLLIGTLKEKRELGQVDFYTKEISRSGISEADAARFQYASIPGAMAFFHMQGNLWVVCLGMFLLVTGMLALEMVAQMLTRNPYLCAFWGMGIAQIVASFGTGVGQIAKYLAICIVAMVAIWIVQVLSMPQTSEME